MYRRGRRECFSRELELVAEEEEEEEEEEVEELRTQSSFSRSLSAYIMLSTVGRSPARF